MSRVLGASRQWRDDETMKHGLAVVLLLNACLASAAASGRISGTVVDEYGNPVPHVIVEAMPTNVELVQKMLKAITDANGWFVLRVDAGSEPEGRLWEVYPDKPTSYCRWSLIDGRTGDSYGQEVKVTRQAPDAIVQLRLVRKVGLLKGQVTDAVSGAPLRPKFESSWASHPIAAMRESTLSLYTTTCTR